MRTISYIILALLIGFSSNTFAATGVSGDGQINQCDQKRYSITLTNNTGNEVTDIEVTNDISLLTGFSYVPGSSAIAACGVTNGDPTSGSTYNLDALCGGAFTLADGESVTIEYDLKTDCTATSGSNQATVTYTMLGVTQSESAQLSIEVLPGAITIKKEPAIQSAAVGDTVSWNLIVENSGLGTIKNVEVTDELGTGLTYVSSSPAGINTAQTTTWNATQEPALASMAPGDTVTITIEATVSACDDLDNKADVRFGCGPGTTCFDTANDGGTAIASIQRLVKTPLLAFTPPNITFDYCGNATPDPVSIVISNNGDGTATNVQTTVDLTPLTVSNVSAGASYDSSQNTFTLDPGTTIPPAGSYTLTFNLEQSAWCNQSLPSSPLLWQKKYEDECGNDFFPPVEMSNITGPADAPALSVTKTGPEVVQIGETISYTINVAHSGLTNCNGSSSTDVTVTDTIPAGFTIDSASSNVGAGVWTPGPNGTGGTYLWNFDPATTANFNATLTLQSPAANECAAFCNTIFDNTVTATVTDCCGCDLSSSASQTTAIECDGSGISSNKTVVPAISQRCDELTYTNDYTFDTTITGIALNELVLTEQAENNQAYKNGSLVIELDGTDQACGTATQGAAGNPLVISLANCPATSITNTNLKIIYTLIFEEDSTGDSCSDLSFYSWSDLYLGDNHPIGNCFGDGTIHETVPINVEAPAMSLSIDGLSPTISTCDTETVTIILEQTSTTASPRDVRLDLSGLNYYVVDPTAITCSGVAPVQCTPTVDASGNYHWDFADAFNGNGQQAVITLNVQKRCTGGPELEATLFFDDKCNDNNIPDETCSISASDTPALLTKADLLITKTPEIYQAAENQATWTIYVTNRGDGTAHNVWIDDTLGSGLDLVTGTTTVSPNTGVTITEDKDHEGTSINGVTIAINKMAPGEKREIKIVTDINDCNNLTNDVSASWGCPNNCQEPVTDKSTVEIPTPNLVYTGKVGTGALAPCKTFPGSIVARNSGQTTVYNVTFSQNLPAGMSYVPDSTRWRLNGGGWNGPNVAAFNPTITAANTLVWTAAQITALASFAVNDKLEIEYQITTDCTWNGGNATLSSTYENPCGASLSGTDRTFTLSPNEVDIRLEKRRTSPAGNVPLGCGDTVEWEINVTNNSGFSVEAIRVTDTVGDGFNTISSSDPGATVSGSQVDWEIGPLAAGATTTLHVSATSDSAPCGTDLDNTVAIQWGCASSGIDNNPATNDYDCLNTAQTTATHESTRVPAAALANLTFAPGSIDSCNDSTTMTLSFENSGPTDASNLDLVLNLPAGISYNSGTAQFGVGTDTSSVTLNPIADPAVSGANLTFTNTGDVNDNLTDILEAAGGNDTAVLQFDVASSCYSGGNVSGNLYFYDCCGGSQHSSNFSQPLPSNKPVLTVIKTPAAGQIDCNGTKKWTITVTNTGSGNAEVVRIEDSPGAWLEVITGAQSDNVTDMGSGLYGWEFNNLAAGTSETRTLTTRLSPGASPADCTAALRQNTAKVFWACGTTGDAVDGDPTTTSYSCEDATPVSVTTSPLPMPDLQVTDITPNITCDASGDGSFTGSITVTVRNNGNGATLSNFDVTVTDGTNTYTGTYNGTLASNASETITITADSWNPDCNSCNPYSFTATVDSGRTVCECNETNNTRTENYTAPITKLAVTNITPDLSCNGESFVDITIANQGCAAVASGVVTRISVTGQSGSTTNNTGTTSGSIAAGASETVRVSMGTLTCGENYTITATVDPDNAICECNANNHSLTDSFTLPCCSINLEKATNTEDADSPPGPYIADGNTVTWTYVITNTGNTALNNITLSDDQLPAGTISCPSNSLAIGASLTCTYSTTVNAAMGNQYENNATVTGTPVDNSGNQIGDDLTDSDPSHFHRYAPAITIEKSTNGVDADTPTGPSVLAGSPIEWTYTVTNTGNLPLTNIVVTDSVEGVISCPATSLDVGANMTCTANGTATAGQYSNNATVTGTSPTGETVSDTDPSHYFGEKGEIDIEKSTNGVDADELPGPYIPSGAPVNWLYRVTNTGNVVLSNINVVDDQGVAVVCPGNTLAPGAFMDCTGSGTSSAPQYSNNATVTGTTPSGTNVTDNDPSHYYSALPSITIEKATNGEDADFPQGPRLNKGDNVTWTYVVTNDGEVLINNIIVTDDQGVSVSCPRTSLDVGESMTCTGTGKAIAGQYRNNATVTGDPIAGPQVTDTDPSHYFAEAPKPPLPPQDKTSQLPPVRTTDNEGCCLSAQKELVAHRKEAEAISVRRNLYYYTHMAMYLAYELADLQRVTDQLPRFPHYRLSSQRERVIELARQASISNVAALTTRSELGVTMKYADGRENETGLRKKLQELADKAGWQGNISGIKPLLFEYFGAIPIKEERNGSHWDPAGMDTELSPLAWGMTILAQSVEFERLTATKTADDQFIRELLGWQLQQKISMLASFLRERSDTEKYFPHRFAQPENGIFKLKATDNDYYLVDQAALLLGISRLGITAQTHELPFAKDINFIRETLWQAMDSRINKDSGIWQPYIDNDRSDAVSEAAEYLVSDLLFAVLAADMANKAEDSWFGSFAYKGRIDDTVKFLRKASNDNGTIGERVHQDSSVEDISFFATTALARMELIAGKTTDGWKRFLAAEQLCNDKQLHLYRPDGLQNGQLSYTPLEMAVFTGFLNEAARQKSNIETTVSDRSLAFIERILFQAGLQIHPGHDGSNQNQPIIADDNRNVVPLLIGSYGNEGNDILPPVALSQILLNPPLSRLSNTYDTNGPDRLEHQPTVSGNTKQFFRHYKKRTINMEEAAMALLYLDDASETLNRLSSWKKNPYLLDNTGLETLSQELARIWKANLYAISFRYSRGIPLTFSPSLEKRFNLSRNELEKRYQQELQSNSDTPNQDEFIPLFIEYNKGEPFATKEAATGWAGTVPDDTILTRALTQFERAQIRFLENLNGQDTDNNKNASQADDARFISDLITMQVGSKMDFIQQLVSKSADSERFLPKAFTVVRDSRNEIIDIEPGEKRSNQLDMLSFALLLADMEQWSAENDKNQATDSRQRQALLDKSVSRLLTMLAEDKRQGIKNSLLDTALTLDLLAQLANHHQLQETQRNAVTKLVKAEAERFVGVAKGRNPIKHLSTIGTVESGRNQLAAYSAVITALVRVQNTIDGMDLGETIKSLAIHFDHRFWNDQLGGYHGQATSYSSNTFSTKTYSYSELDMSLTINSLAATLEFLNEKERHELIQHLVSFGRRLLVFQESSTSVLNGLPQSSKEFDLEIMQDMDVVATNHKNIYPGDSLRYKIEVYNRCKQGQPTPPLGKISIRDILPQGVFYLPGTTKINGENAEDPESRADSLYWQLDKLDDYASISFAVHVPPAYRFNKLENRIEVRADMGGNRRNRFCNYTDKISDPVNQPNSSVDVVYYYDTNLNQRFDIDETNARGISTIIDGEPLSARTDNANRFEKLSSGWHLLTPDWESIDSFIVPTRKTPVQTMLSANKHKTEYIGLVQYTDVEGLIYDDRNHNGQKEKNEPILSRARVALKNRPEYYGYSGKDGYFRIEHIPTDDRFRNPAVIFSEHQPYIENDQNGITSIGIDIKKP